MIESIGEKKRRRERNREIVIQERKYSVCGDFGHITYYYRNKREFEENRRLEVGKLEHQPTSNKFEVLTSQVMKTMTGADSCYIDANNSRKEKREKLLKKVMVKIGLKQKYNENRITVEVLLDSKVIGLVMSSEFVRRNKFKKKKLDRLIYREHKKRIEINIIRGQKQGIILEMPQL